MSWRRACTKLEQLTRAPHAPKAAHEAGAQARRSTGGVRRKTGAMRRGWEEGWLTDGETLGMQYEDIKRRKEEEEQQAGKQGKAGVSLGELDKLKESVQERIGLKK